jgi:hypothetical protein
VTAEEEERTDTQGTRPKRQWSEARRNAQRRRGTSAESTRPDSELIAEDAIAEAVANITTLAGYALPIAPYTAVTIAGVPHPDSTPERPLWIVQSRAELAGRVLLEHAKRNPRILAAVARFNLMFKNVELL